jgi:hypothetical protein
MATSSSEGLLARSVAWASSDSWRTRIGWLSQLVSGAEEISGVGGALILETWSEETLPSSDGGVCNAGTKRGSRESVSDDTGILGGGVGGTGELLGPERMGVHRVVEGIMSEGRLGGRPRLRLEQVELRKVVVRLVGRLLLREGQSSASSSVAS